MAASVQSGESARTPFRTASCRVLPPGTTARSLEHCPSSRRYSSTRSSRVTTTISRISGTASTAARVRRITGMPSSGSASLSLPPMRLELPAAAITAPTAPYLSMLPPPVLVLIQQFQYSTKPALSGRFSL